VALLDTLLIEVLGSLCVAVPEHRAQIVYTELLDVLMLTNPFYAGTYRYNYRDESKASFSVKKEAEWVLVENHHPAIVSKEKQSYISMLLKSKQRGTSNRTYQRKHVHIFSGLLSCGYCGSNMAATIDREHADGSRPSVYGCTRAIEYENFIAKIDPQIVKDFLNSIVSNFCIKNGLTTSILFKNGIFLEFSYKGE
jgi:hypothetical protein